VALESVAVSVLIADPQPVILVLRVDDLSRFIDRVTTAARVRAAAPWTIAQALGRERGGLGARSVASAYRMTLIVFAPLALSYSAVAMSDPSAV
jgi:hypothetical protein